VQDVHPVASRPLDAAIPGIRQTSVLGFAVERHPAGAKSLSNFKCCVVLGAVINYLDLHLLRPRVLLEHAAQSFL
jgi:hypothetical protein